MNQVGKNLFTVKSSFLLTLSLLHGVPIPANSQISNNSYIEIGSNYASAGTYGSLSSRFSSKSGNFETTAGCLFTIPATKGNAFSALKLGASNDFKLKRRKLNVGATYLFKPFSADLNETDFAILASYKTSHFGYALGLNSRIYCFNRAATVKYNFPDSVKTSVWEPVNLMYRISYMDNILPKLNYEISVTNYNQYLFQQETNPMFLLNLNYKFGRKFQLYSELEYMQAGMVNIRVNYFGLCVRGGMVWQIN
ncbi:MAG TPA: hypothetical protein VK152_02680 [Paludibacter sp.]|nr:hypothetical protein [Paludibacter sp.]